MLLAIMQDEVGKKASAVARALNHVLAVAKPQEGYEVALVCHSYGGSSRVREAFVSPDGAVFDVRCESGTVVGTADALVFEVRFVQTQGEAIAKPTIGFHPQSER